MDVCLFKLMGYELDIVLVFEHCWFFSDPLVWCIPALRVSEGLVIEPQDKEGP